MDIGLIQKAIIFAQNGKFAEAENLYKKLLAENPEEVPLLSAVGLFYTELKDYDKASEFLQKAYNLKKTFGTVSALGFCEYAKKEYKTSAIYLEEALEYGQNIDIFDKLIASLFEIKSYKKAIEYSNKMYELYPNDTRAIANKIKSLTQSGKLREAEQLCVESIKKNPEAPILWFHLGYLKELIYRDDKQAIECYKIAEKYGANEANYNIAVGFQKLGQKKEAEKYYKKMLEFFPNDEETMTSLGMCLLSQKKFNEGYKLFCKRDAKPIEKYSNNIWKTGDKIENDIVVICEQGFGDHIQFIRYLPFINAKKIQIAAPKQLRKLFESNYPKFNFIDYSEINPQKQALRVTDLAYILGIDFEHIPFSDGYLNSEKADIKSDKLKIGLCWEAGAAGIRTMINRTIHVKFFERFFNNENIQTYSFQYDDTFNGCEKFPQMINLAKGFKDFFDTASAIKAMDAIITVDTSVAHLAGALGVKTYLLLPYSSDWRWFDDTKTTPWYKSVKIFKQIDPISWEGPLAGIEKELF